MMGMGEPLYNFEAVRDAIGVIADGDGLSISKRRITLSTSGVVPMIARAGAEIGCMLAVSLHAVRDELRNELVPLNRKYPIAELLDACRNYPGVSNARRITFEYVMLKGVNDSIADAKALVRLLKGIPAKINLIPFNPWPGIEIRMLGLGADREILRGRVQRRLCLAGAHAARPRHPRRLRPAQERDREALRARAHGAARHGDDGLISRTQMENLIRLLMRFILVPLGYLAASIAGTLVVLVASWQLIDVARSGHPDAPAYVFLGLAIGGPILLRAGDRIRVAAGVGRHPDLGSLRDPLVDLPCAQRRRVGLARLAVLSAASPARACRSTSRWCVVAAGIAGGFAYWAVAGFSAGFYKPVFREPAACDGARNHAVTRARYSVG